MATLIFKRESKDARLLLLGINEEGESARYTVNLSTFDQIFTPSVGDFLDEEQMSAIRYCDELIRAKKKALSILSYADNNRKNLAAKLHRAGFNRDIVGEVCDEMISLGYIDERDQIERLIRLEADRKLRGPGRIIPALAAKGYSPSLIREVMGELVNSGEIDFRKNAELLLDKKLPNGGNDDEKKTILYKNGYKI